MLGSPTSLVNLQELVASGKLNVEAFEEILDRISEFLTTTSQGLAVDIALQQIYGLLGKNSNRGFKMLKVIAEQAGCNNDDAIKELARCYRDGRGCEMNLSLAQYWVAQLQKLYVKAANLGNVQAMHNAGNLYLKGYGRRIDILNAQKMFIKAANTGDIDSIYYLGCLYLNGKLGDHDPAIGIKFINQAIDLWKDLAIRGNTKAIDALVEIYLGKDNADFKSYSEAKNWLNIKLSLNHLDVSDTDKFKLNLISWLSSSPRNFAEGINLFFPGSCEGENDYILDKSCYYLKKILNLESVTSEEKQAIIQKILSFKDNEKKPYKVGRILGDIYSQGVLVEPDYQTSLFWYTKSAMLGNGTAMYHIGKLYETAKLGGIDLVKAVEWYEASAKDNNVAAISCLIRLHNSIGYVAQNITNLNFPHEDPQNMHNLGMQWRREEQEKSKVPLLAAYWLRKAAKREHAESAFILGEMYSNGELGYNLRSVGAKWYKVAAKNGHSIAMHTLYNMYATDNSIVVKSLDKADKWKFRVEKCFNDSVANIKI